MNLIPDKIPETGAYFCTWATQARVRPMSMGDDSLDVRNSLTEDFLFGDRGILSEYFDGIRGDLVALLDDGWDVPLGTNNPEDTHKFGSFELDEERFPGDIGSPVERLWLLADQIRSLGYKGVGLWIACQKPFAENVPAISEADAIEIDRSHWERAAKISHMVGVDYWKVDWGRYASSIGYREMMTECVRKYAPGLKIEHYPHGMYPPFGKYRFGADHFTDSEREYNRRVCAASDYLRTYDVLGEFANAITLNRVALLLSESNAELSCVLNVEDSLYLGAGLGCAVGVMRHPRFAPGRERRNTARYNEIVRTLRWQRIAPPFAGGDYQISDEMLTDRYTFPTREVDVWPFVSGKTLESSAPLSVSRGCELAAVEPAPDSPAKPYVVCSKNPTTGAFSVAAINRTDAGITLEYFRAEVTVGVADADKSIGIFGRFATLTVKLDRDITGKRIFAQDLAADEAIELTASVQLDGDRLILDGELIDSLCKNPDWDDSAPGIVLEIK